MPIYQYDRPEQNRYAGTIGDILREQGLIAARRAEQVGQIQARAAEQSGNAWAGAVQNLGQIPQQVQQQQRVARQEEASTLQLGEQKRAIATRDAFTKIIAGTPTVDEDGVSLFDVSSISKQLAANGHDPSLATHLNDLNQGFRAEKAAKASLVKLGAEKVMAAGNDPVLAGVFLAQLKKNGSITAEQADQYGAFIEADPGNVAKLTAYLAGPQKMERGAPGSVAVNPITGGVVPGSKVEDDPSKGAYTGPDGVRYKADGTPLTGDVMKPQTSKGLQTEKFRLDGKDVMGTFNPESGAYQYQGQDVTGRAAPIPAASVTIHNENAAAAKVNASSQADLVQQGLMPPSMLSKRASDYGATITEADKLNRERTGKPLNLAQLETQYKAAQRFSASLNGPNMVRFQALGKSVVNTIDEVLSLAGELKQGGIQKWNQAKRSTIQQVYGNTPQSELAAKYVAAVNTLKEEYAGLAQGGFAPTEPAWKLANEQINGDFGAKDLSAALYESQRLINFRLHGFTDLQPLLPGANNGAQAPASSASPDLTGLTQGHGRTFNDGPYKGQTWTIGADGKPAKVGG